MKHFAPDEPPQPEPQPWLAPLKRRTQVLLDTGRFTPAEAERLAFETLERRPCRK